MKRGNREEGIGKREEGIVINIPYTAYFIFVR